MKTQIANIDTRAEKNAPQGEIAGHYEGGSTGCGSAGRAAGGKENFAPAANRDPGSRPRAGEIAVCAECGREFLRPAGSWRDWCRNACYKKLFRRRLPHDAACPVCGRTFARTHPRQKFCSNACSGVAKTKRPPRAAQPETGVCPVCGKTFVRGSALQKYCSRTCKDKAAYYGANTAAREPDAVCPTCGGAFAKKQAGQVYCCNRCWLKSRLSGKRANTEGQQAAPGVAAPRASHLIRERDEATGLELWVCQALRLKSLKNPCGLSDRCRRCHNPRKDKTGNNTHCAPLPHF